MFFFHYFCVHLNLHEPEVQSVVNTDLFIRNFDEIIIVSIQKQREKEEVETYNSHELIISIK